MNTFNKIVFKIARLLIQVFLIIMYFFEVIFFIGMIILLFHLDNDNASTYSRGVANNNIYVNGPIIIILIMLMLVTIILISKNIKKIIYNLDRKNYFIQNNAIYIRNILYSFIAFIGFNLIINVYTSINKLQNISGIFNIGHSSIINYIIYFIILITIYVIYNVFKQGIKVQQDSDSVI